MNSVDNLMISTPQSVPTEVNLELPCPNCGKDLRVQATSKKFSCPECKEELVWSTEEYKLLLAKPLSTYLDTGNDARELATIWERADQAGALIDLRRRQATVEIATRWIGERIALGKRYFKIGTGLSGLSIGLLSLAFMRIILTGSLPLEAFSLFIIASLIIPFGFFFFMWSLVDRFAMAKYIKRVQDERRTLQAEELSLQK